VQHATVSLTLEVGKKIHLRCVPSFQLLPPTPFLLLLLLLPLPLPAAALFI
jgi:hypothetical protein